MCTLWVLCDLGPPKNLTWMTCLVCEHISDADLGKMHFRSQIVIGSVHKFAHATAAMLPWHVQICDLIGSLESKLEQKEFSQNFHYICEMCPRTWVVAVSRVCISWTPEVLHFSLLTETKKWSHVKTLSPVTAPQAVKKLPRLLVSSSDQPSSCWTLQYWLHIFQISSRALCPLAEK